MPLIHYTTYTCLSYRNILYTSELPNLKENKPRYQFQKLEEIIPINVMNDLINPQSVKTSTQIGVKNILRIGSLLDNLYLKPDEKYTK
ncbi:MAG: hypothetical protein IPI90_07735 [Saprospiraceae bacterium]|nr:hypothetical protein [Candidatus Vicinibacter affinis]